MQAIESIDFFHPNLIRISPLRHPIECWPLQMRFLYQNFSISNSAYNSSKSSYGSVLIRLFVWQFWIRTFDLNFKTLKTQEFRPSTFELIKFLLRFQGEMPFQCRLCPKKFNDRGNFRRHHLDCHSVGFFQNTILASVLYNCFLF